MRQYFCRTLIALLFLGGMTSTALALTTTWYVSGAFESSNNTNPALIGSFDFDPDTSTASNVSLTANSGQTLTNCCQIDWDKVVFGWAGQATYVPADNRFYTFFYIDQFQANNPTPATAALGLVFSGNPASLTLLNGVLGGQSDQGYCSITNGSCDGINRSGGALFPHRDLISLTMTTTPPAGVAPVPLPATGWLLLGGIGAFAAFRRRSMRAQSRQS
ncbi:VPLPA-CTERM sorting domain-containing protein [Ruegeria lacuscaerulensis]|uniref:VPLPA-CTERM sorting domain-containing protein n=1 Tax=Ruegeria lacuscaerulensis TaxID=55218 RepID=UPI001F468A12|nr:VPLPA-CTERM sorting domain-containing protein [Ruegeria lacuscaerulensis]